MRTRTRRNRDKASRKTTDLSANLLVSESAVATARADRSSEARPPPEVFSTDARAADVDFRLREGETERDLDLGKDVEGKRKYIARKGNKWRRIGTTQKTCHVRFPTERLIWSSIWSSSSPLRARAFPALRAVASGLFPLAPFPLEFSPFLARAFRE